MPSHNLTLASTSQELIRRQVMDLVLTGNEQNVNRIHHRLARHVAPVLGLSANGGLLATSCKDGEIGLWDMNSENIRPRYLHQLSRFPIHAIYLLPGGRLLTADMAGVVREFDTKARRMVRQWNDVVTGGIEWLAVSPDKRMLAVNSWESETGLLDLATGQKVAHGGHHKKKAKGMAFSPDGLELASCGEDGTIFILDSRTLKVKRHFEIASPLFVLAWWRRKSGTLLVAAGINHLYFFENGKHRSGTIDIKEFCGPAEMCLKFYFLGLGFHAPMDRMVAITSNGHIFCINMKRQPFVVDVHGKLSSRSSGGCFQKDSRLLISSRNEVEWFDMETMKTGQAEISGCGGIDDLHVAYQDGKPLMLLSEHSKTVRLVELSRGSTRLFLPHRDWVYRTRIGPEDGHIYTSCCDGTVRKYDGRTGSLLAEKGGYEHGLNAVCPGRKVVVVGGRAVRNNLHVLDTDLRLLFPLNFHRSASVTDLDLHEERGLIAFVNATPRDKCHSITEEIAVFPLKEAIAPLWTRESRSANNDHISFSPDGLAVLYSDQPGEVLVLEATTGRELPPVCLTGCHEKVSRVIFDRKDSNRLAVATNEGTVFIFDFVLRMEIDRFKPHEHTITGLFLEGERLVTASVDGRVKYSNSHTGALLAIFQGMSDGHFLWTTPHGEQGKNWFYASSPENQFLVYRQRKQEGADASELVEEELVEDEQERRAHLLAHNSSTWVMRRIFNPTNARNLELEDKRRQQDETSCSGFLGLLSLPILEMRRS
ncbi:MAG: hypothetical protein HQL73_10440 [Magnetococcales bacterium]|nr:hypothetical protein [Magnetococcales bacterium]